MFKVIEIDNLNKMQFITDDSPNNGTFGSHVIKSSTRDSMITRYWGNPDVNQAKYFIITYSDLNKLIDNGIDKKTMLIINNILIKDEVEISWMSYDPVFVNNLNNSIGSDPSKNVTIYILIEEIFRGDNGTIADPIPNGILKGNSSYILAATIGKTRNEPFLLILNLGIRFLDLNPPENGNTVTGHGTEPPGVGAKIPSGSS